MLLLFFVFFSYFRATRLSDCLLLKRFIFIVRICLSIVIKRYKQTLRNYYIEEVSAVEYFSKVDNTLDSQYLYMWLAPEYLHKLILLL